MLKLLRESFKHLKFILWAVVAVFVLLIFVDWGAGRASRGDRSPMAGVALKIGDTSISEAMAVMTQRRCRHLPVMEGKELRGMVSIGDCTRWVSRDQNYTIHHLQEYIHGKYPA